MNRLMNFISYFTLALGFGLVISVAVMLFYPFKACYFYPDGFQTVKKSYHQGEVLTYRTHIRKYYAIKALCIQAFVDGIVYQLPERVTNNPVGESDFTNVSVVVPKSLPTGKYHLATTVIYKLNPLRDEIHTARSNEFEVTE